MQLVGPLPRGIFNAAAFDGRTAAGDGALQATGAPVAEEDYDWEGEKLWGAGNPFWRLRRLSGSVALAVWRPCGTQMCVASLIFEWGHVCVSGSGPQRVPLAVTACRSPS
ncbi:uncharacterized protein Tco025E_10270 [Trypanosoma conorhini]|uniref:Uncharacterized protein n=1 Tax=Trypanosoma conorhini TaxID=83891 RepID=A0A3R7LDB9_9TRYP|nr:uncharacterized protein Tco025E_10270 [Trypanosoma conorhini]RNE94958.1 hypothetical protein Tco025E_10270 [Trypanosoma conorhini]